MKFSQFFVPTSKEVPTDYQILSQILMFRAGMILPVSSGLFVYLPMFNRVLNKVSNIIRKHLNKIGCSEVKFPILVSKETLDETGRWNAFGNEMFKLKDRNKSEYAISPTNEESACFLAKNYIKSYKNLPFSIFQIQQKHRDEKRPKNGVLRAREFIMKDAYSFHTDSISLDEYFEKMHTVYLEIFKELGLKVVSVEADTGAMGGTGSIEIMAPAEFGESDIAICSSCNFGANLETIACAEIQPKEKVAVKNKEIIKTPNMKTIKEVSNFLGLKETDFCKSLVYDADGKLVLVLIRGDKEVNETKLINFLKASSLELADENKIKKELNSIAGFVGPVGIKNIRILADYTVQGISNFIVGANAPDKHIINVNISDFKAEFCDLRFADEKDKCPKCGKEIKITKATELGHIFKLGQRYTKPLNLTYVASNGKDELMSMGCYGIGLERTVATIIDQHNDENGIVWPSNIAPFKVNVITVNMSDENQKSISEQIYKELISEKVDAIWDDRNERPGFKFKDSDLIGIPLKIIVGKNVLENSVEIVSRKGKSFLVKISEISSKIKEMINDL